MELTRRCDYACRILRSAYRHGGDYVSIAEVSEEEDIPYAFARTIQHELATAGYLKTTRGARGGLSLSIDPAEVTVLDVLHVLQGPIGVAPCSQEGEVCSMCEGCSFNKVWMAADRALTKLFSSVTLLDVFAGDIKVKLTDVERETDELVSKSIDSIVSDRSSRSGDDK